MLDALNKDLLRTILANEGLSEMDAACVAMSCKSGRLATDHLCYGLFVGRGSQAMSKCSDAQIGLALRHLTPGAGAFGLETMLAAMSGDGRVAALRMVIAEAMRRGVRINSDAANRAAASAGKLESLVAIRSMEFRRRNFREIDIIRLSTRWGHVHIMEWIIDRHGPSINRRQMAQWVLPCVARAAVSSGSADVFKFLLENGIMTTGFKRMATMYSVVKNKTDVMDLLDGCGVDTQCESIFRSFCYMAVQYGSNDVIERWVLRDRLRANTVANIAQFILHNEPELASFVSWVRSI